jgi:hypothetical protein
MMGCAAATVKHHTNLIFPSLPATQINTVSVVSLWFDLDLHPLLLPPLL